MIHPKIIMGYKATPHKIVRNIDGEWYESRPTKEIWPTGSDDPDINGDYDGGYDCAYRWFPVGKDYPKGEWYEIKPSLYGWESDFKPGQKPLSAYYWHMGEPEPTFLGGWLMATQDKNSNPFEIIDGQVILHDEIQGVDRVVINYEQVGAIKLLLEALKNGEI